MIYGIFGRHVNMMHRLRLWPKQMGASACVPYKLRGRGRGPVRDDQAPERRWQEDDSKSETPHPKPNRTPSSETETSRTKPVCSSFLGLPSRILNRNHIKPKKSTMV